MSMPPDNLSQTGPLDPNKTPSPEEIQHRGHLPERNQDVPSHLLVQIHVADGSIVTVGLAVAPRMIFGRSDPTTNFTPDLDLTPFGGKDAGVSRQHVNLFHDGKQLYAQDNYSRNKTTLNNQLLDPAQPVALSDGDVLMLGRLVLTIYFVNKAATS